MIDHRTISRLALACCLATAAPLYAQQIADPANLTGEHVAPQALADTLPINHGAPALQQLLLKLRSRASMMMIVAHPDDEDGGFLTYESRGQGARVAMLTLNRGEGGQNLMSADFDGALGLIRTQELLAADRYMGVDQYFGTEVDFGFSKTKEESFAKWTHDRVLYDAVRCVRLYRPLILASVFVGGVTDGHGQHQVSGEITQEVFLAAADPRVFPEMGLPPWAPLKVYARTPFARIDAEGMYDYATGKYSPVLFHNYVTGADITHAPVATVTIHESTPSDRLGMNGDTYVQFARRGLALQRSQIGAGGRAAPSSATIDVGYTLMASRVCAKSPCPIHPDSGMSGATYPLPASEQSPFDSIDTSLPAIATLAPSAPPSLRATLTEIDTHIAEAQKLFDPSHLEATAAPLRDALKTLDTLIDGTEKSTLPTTQKFNLLHELRIKRVQLNNALILALGLEARTFEEADSTVLTPGNQAHIRTTIDMAKRDAPIRDLRIHLNTPEGPINPASSAAGNLDYSLKFVVPANSPATGPYFSQKDPEQPFYDISDPNLRNAPQTPPPFVAVVHLASGGVPLELQSIAANPTQTAPAQAAVVVPRLSVSISPGIQVISTSSTIHAPLNFMVDVRTNVRDLSPRIELSAPPDWKITSPEDDFKLAQINDSHSIHVSITPTRDDMSRGRDSSTLVRAFAMDPKIGDKTGTDLGYRAVGYNGLTSTNLYKPAAIRVESVDVTTAPNLHVAYLPGTGDAVPEFLPNLGVTPTILTLKDLTPETLQKYDAILLGVRAYAAHPELAGKGSQPLIDYAKQGGVVILQYNNGRFGPDEAPYPITAPLSSGDHAHDVVDESQPVQVLVPNAPLLTWPNKITAADFNDWVAERGHGFAGTWAPEYTALLETHDPGQDPQKGGLIVAPVGKGAYIYCGLALYRQLPEGVPGAYRLFANLLSYAKNPNR